jgi:hypothetical protein
MLTHSKKRLEAIDLMHGKASSLRDRYDKLYNHIRDMIID